MTFQFILWAVSAFCMFSFALFKISCLFKKKCSWKNCPFRAKTLSRGFPFDCVLYDTDCHKCPYPFDEEEEKELNETIKELIKMIEQL